MNLTGFFCIVRYGYPGRIPAAPENAALPLLPFGPGGVWQAPPRRACPDSESILDVQVAVNSKHEGGMVSEFPLTRAARSLFQQA
jgi:hypothetical protein